MPEFSNVNTESSLAEAVAQIDQLIEQGEALRETDPPAAILLFEEAWELCKSHQLIDKLKQIVPHLGYLYFRVSDGDKVVSFNREALELGEQTDDDELIAKSCQAIGYILARSAKIGQTMVIYEQGLEAAERSGDKRIQAGLLNNLGAIYQKLFRLPDSLDAFLKALRISEENGDLEIMRQTCNNLATQYYKVDDIEQFLHYTNKGIELAEQLNSPEGGASFYNNLGRYYSDRHEYSVALEYYKKTIAILENTYQRKHIYAHTLLNAGNICTNLDDFSQAEMYFIKALAYSEENELVECMLLGKADLALCWLRGGDPEKGDAMLEEVLELMKNLDSQLLLQTANMLIHRYLYERGDYKGAADHMYTTFQLAQQHFNEEITTQTAKLRVQFEMEQKEREAALYRERSAQLEAKNKALEEAYEKLQNAQEAIRQLERRNSVYAMAVTANHEINQPLMIIQGNLDLLEAEIDKSNPEKVRHFSRIQDALERIEKLLAKFRRMEGVHIGEYNRETPMVLFDDFNDSNA